MDNALLVCVLDSVADVDEQIQSLAYIELVLVAVSRNGHAVDQFHDKIGSSGIRGPGIQDLGDVGMVHQGQGLTFGPESGNHLVRVHAQLDDLEGNVAAHGPLLLGHVHHGHPAFTDPLQQMVAADDRAGTLHDRQAVQRDIQLIGRGFKKITKSILDLEQ